MNFNTFNRFGLGLPICFLDTDDSGGGNDSNSVVDGEGNENPNKDSTSGKGSSVDLAVQAQLIDLTTKHGSVDAAAKFLIKRNYTLEQGKSSGLPKAEKEAFDAFKALNMSAADIEAMRADYGPLKEGAARAATSRELEKAAPTLGFKPSVLKRLAPNLPVLSKEIDVKGDDGKFTKETRYFFKDGDKETEISAYFADDEEALSLLKADEVEQLPANRQQLPATRPYVPQGGSSGKSQSSDPIEQRRQARETARQNNPNPLMPQKQGVGDRK